MSAEEDDKLAMKQAFKAYADAKGELMHILFPMPLDDFDVLASDAEEFGARYMRQAIQAAPARYGLPQDRFASDEQLDRLEQALSQFIERNEALDRVIGARGARLFDEGENAKSRTIAFHGDLATVDLDRKTMIFNDGRGYALVMREGRGPDNSPVPEQPQTRGRKR